MKAVIFCGGYGTRIREFNNKVPKPLIKVNKVPIVYRISQNLFKQGVERVYLLTGYKSDEFHKNNLIRKEKKIECIDTGVGTETGERLRLIKNYLINEIFLITYGDSYVEFDLKKATKIHKNKKKILSSTFFKYYFPYGSYEYDGKHTSFKEKHFININSGFYLTNFEIFKSIKKNESFEKSTLPRLIKSNNFSLSVDVKKWYPMDNYYDYLKLLHYLND